MALTIKDINIKDMFEAYLTDDTAFSGMAVTLGNNDDITTTITPALIFNVLQNYLSWTIPCYSYGTPTPTDTTLFINKWVDFKNRRKDAWDRIAVALLTEYAPLENYDKHTEITVKNPLVETEVTIASRTNSDVIASKTVHEKETSYQSSTAVESGSTTADGYTDTHTAGGGTDITKVKAHNVITEDYTHGNVGVTRSQEMAVDELRLRAYDVTKIIVNEFITEYAYLI